MITIGYGNGLPTAFAANAMWNYHTTSLGEQLVVSLNSPLTDDGIESVYGAVCALLYDTDLNSPLPAIDTIQGMGLDLDGNHRLAIRFYNNGVNTCARRITTPTECTAVLGLSTQGLERLFDIAQELERVAGADNNVSTAVANLLLKIDGLLKATQSGRLVSKLTDVQMQEVLGFGSMKGSLLEKSAAIGKRAVTDVQAPIVSLEKFLDLYKPETMEEIDNRVTDGFLGLGELFREAKINFPVNKPNLASIAGIANLLALPGKNSRLGYLWAVCGLSIEYLWGIYRVSAGYL